MCLLRHTFTDSGGSKLMPNRIVKNDNNRETFFRAEHIRQFFFLLIIYCIYPGHFDVLFLVAHIIADPDPGSGSVFGIRIRIQEAVIDKKKISWFFSIFGH